MAKTCRSRKEKGRRLEVLIAKRIEKVLGEYGIHATRTPMSGAIDRFKGDIFTNLPICIEAKNQERLNFRKAWEQAKNQAGHKTPVLMSSRNNDPEILVMLELDDFLWIVEFAIRSGWE